MCQIHNGAAPLKPDHAITKKNWQLSTGKFECTVACTQYTPISWHSILRSSKIKSIEKGNEEVKLTSDVHNRPSY